MVVFQNTGEIRVVKLSIPKYEKKTREIRFLKLSYSKLILSYLIKGCGRLKYVNVGDGNVMRRGSYSMLPVLLHAYRNWMVKAHRM